MKKAKLAKQLELLRGEVEINDEILQAVGDDLERLYQCCDPWCHDTGETVVERIRKLEGQLEDILVTQKLILAAVNAQAEPPKREWWQW